jgi:hypothetical protein
VTDREARSTIRHSCHRKEGVDQWPTRSRHLGNRSRRGKEKRHDDLELPEETAEQVKGGSWDIKKDS